MSNSVKGLPVLDNDIVRFRGGTGDRHAGSKRTRIIRRNQRISGLRNWWHRLHCRIGAGGNEPCNNQCNHSSANTALAVSLVLQISPLAPPDAKRSLLFLFYCQIVSRPNPATINGFSREI
jgi:hypothetical protein